MNRNMAALGVVVDFITGTGCEVVARLDSIDLGQDHFLCFCECHGNHRVS
jgi:hypothetical protein